MRQSRRGVSGRHNPQIDTDMLRYFQRTKHRRWLQLTYIGHDGCVIGYLAITRSGTSAETGFMVQRARIAQ